MKKDIKGYLHLYIGSQVARVGEPGHSGTLKGVCASEVEAGKTIAIIDEGGKTEVADWFAEVYPEEIQLLLRPLSDMTEDEARELFVVKDQHQKIDFKWTRITLEKYPTSKFETAMKFEPGWRVNAAYRYPDDPNGKERGMIGTLSLGIFSPSQFTLLLSKGFDLFNLIPEGLAIDRTKVKP